MGWDGILGIRRFDLVKILMMIGRMKGSSRFVMDSFRWIRKKERK